MNKETREALINTILANEKLRPLSRIERLWKDPIHALPYYILAAASRIRPFKLRFKTLWNTHMSCYLPEGNTFYYYGYCEANLTNFLLRYLQPGMTILDVGSHVGFYSMLSAELVGHSGKVHAFEPTPRTFAILRDNTQQYSQVAIFNQAIGSEADTLVFSDYGPGYGAYNTAHPNGASMLHKQSKTVEVKCITIDEHCQTYNLLPDFIKIDTEGLEPKVLAGAMQTLSKGKQRPLVTIEVAGGTEWSAERAGAFKVLKQLDYIPYTMLDDGFLTPHALQETYHYDNLLFVPTERTDHLEAFIQKV